MDNGRDFDNEGCVRLMCAIAEVRSTEYRKAYQGYLKEISKNNVAGVKECLAKMNQWERKLKRFPTSLDDGDFEKIKRQVKSGKEYIGYKAR